MNIGPQTFTPFIFLPPALCDVIGTSIMYMGLQLTSSSSFQMLRGSLIIFTGILSVIFLRRRLQIYKWIGMFVVLVGLVIVGLSDILLKKKDKDDVHSVSNQVLGDILIIGAQVITATQMILEEKFIGKHDVPPLQAVGWEGAFGLIMISFIMIILNYIHVPAPFGKPPRMVLEDPVDGFVQIGNNYQVLLAVLGNIVSIAFFNFAGITVTKELTATTRTVLDSIRTLVVWLFALAISWETFTYLQPVGFIFLVFGMFIYNDVLFRPYLIRKGWLITEFTPEEKTSLLNEDDYGIQNKDQK